MNEKKILDKFLNLVEGGMQPAFLPVLGHWRFIITRADGTIEEHANNNIVTKDGLNSMANRVVNATIGVNSAFQYIIVGTATAQGSLGSVQGGIGEVSRKIASTIANSNEVSILVATWAGAADGLSGIPLGTAGITNHVDSGQGVFGSHVNSVDATLNDSDFLRVQMEVQIGSHAL